MSFARAIKEFITGCSISLRERAVEVLSHGLTKKQVVPPREIDRALQRKRMVEAEFEKFPFRPE
jgi:hypothetical protein